MSEVISIRVNGDCREINTDTTVSSLLELLKLNQGRVAVEINREIVPRSQHARWTLRTGDVVEIVHAIGGG